jgi:hypothetical protein
VVASFLLRRGRRGMGVVRGARSAPLGGRKGGRGRGGTAETRAVGGFPGSPVMLAGFPGAEGAARYMRGRAKGWSLRSFHGHAWRFCLRISSVIDAVGSVVWGGRNGGPGGNLEPGRDFAGPGGSGFPPSAFPDWSPLLSVYSCSRDVVFLTSTTLLCEGLRSGTWRRRGTSTSVQAAGGTGPETPARPGAALHCHCAGRVAELCAGTIEDPCSGRGLAHRCLANFSGSRSKRLEPSS